MHSATAEASPVMAPHRKLTVEQYHRMGETGILGADERVELIEGELIDMAPIGHFHAGLGSLLIEVLAHRTQGQAIAWVQNPIRLDRYSEPQPDFALLRYRPDHYKQSLPTAADVLLVVEIADSTVRYDREIKGALYGRHHIPEYWLINVPERCVEIYQEADEGGHGYRNQRTIREGLLVPESFPDITIDVGDLLR
ncbi:MAG: Uma2 family endonuclease [Methylohalobius crimeensis]